MRHSNIRLSLLVGVVAFLPATFDGERTALADTPTTQLRPAANPGSLASGAYFLLLYPKRMDGKPISAKRPGVVPVVVKTDGKTVVIGGKYLQMTGTNENGNLKLTHQPGASLSFTGNTFNGYAASGTFTGGSEGNFEGSFALATVSGGGYGFLDNGTGGGISGARTPGSKGGFGGSQPAGSNRRWGYDGPGLNMDGNGRSQNGFSIPGSSGANADGWKDGLNITGSKSADKGTNPNGVGSKKAAADAFANSGSGSIAAPSVSTNDGGWVDWVKCAFVACGPAPAPATDTPPGSGKPDAGGFQAGDWEPMGGDTSPGQKPKTGNGQDQGQGSTTVGSKLHLPLGGGDASDFFKPNPGDILNTNKLFNGASDPVRGANFGR